MASAVRLAHNLITAATSRSQCRRALRYRGCRRLAALTAAEQQQQQQETQRHKAVAVVAAAPLATELLAYFFAQQLHPGDCYLLHGSVGAGKSYFSRAFIRTALENDSLPVPSPTFLLQNTYEGQQGPPIHHFDLYRLTQPHELRRLNLPSSFTTAVSLVEWAERLGDELPPQHLAARLDILEPAEQQALQQQGLAAPPPDASNEDETEEWASADGSGDARWRRIELTPHGAGWESRLQLLQSYIAAEGSAYGCWLLPAQSVSQS